MRVKTRFNADELVELVAEVDDLQHRLSELGKRLQDANIEHTRSRFWDPRVREIADALPTKLRPVERLLAEDIIRHGDNMQDEAIAELKRKSAEAQRQVRA